jgi:hypothetical protein
MADKLFDSQIETLELHERSPIVFDMSDPGTGKTRVVAKAYLEHVHPAKLVVTCTKSTMQVVWENEFYAVAPEIQVQVLGANTRKHGLDPSKDVYVINHDGIKWLREEVNTNRSLRKIFAASMIANDESTYYKHRSSARAKAAADVSAMFQRRTNLSGSPMTNTVLDLWHQYYLLDQGKRLGWSFSKFRNSVCSPVPVTRDIVRWVDKPAAYGAVMDGPDITIRHPGGCQIFHPISARSTTS